VLFGLNARASLTYEYITRLGAKPGGDRTEDHLHNRPRVLPQAQSQWSIGVSGERVNRPNTMTVLSNFLPPVLFLGFNILPPLLIVAFLALWSVAWGSRDDLGYWGVSFSGRAILLAGMRFFVLFVCYILFASQGQFRWDNFIAPISIAAALEAVNRTQFYLAQPFRFLWRLWGRWRARLRYRNFEAMRNVVAHSNTLATLDQSLRMRLAELPNWEEHRALEEELNVHLAQQTSSESRRLMLAVALLENLPWSELKRDGLIPPWALDLDGIVDPEITVELLVDFCEQRAITADDLDRYIRQRLRDQSTSMIASYEMTLAENQDDTSERRRLGVRSRFLVKMFGPQAVTAEGEQMAAAIAAIKKAVPTPVPAAKPVTDKALGTLKLLGVELENIRCFRPLKLDFSEDGKPRPWTMLLGDNGLGKTTILRSIVMALCDPNSAAGLMGRLPGEVLRQHTTQGRIRVQLALPDVTDQEIWTETTLIRGPSATELRQSSSSWFPRDLLFICGYGAWRSGLGTQSYSGYATAGAVASLFDPAASLQNPELALRRMMSAGENMDRVCRQIESVLLLKENSTEFGSSGLSIKGKWGEFVPVGAIGDGYLATLAWLSDFLGWTFLYRPELIAGHVSAIVVIDEIEKHLHPRWQREIVRELSRQFPQVQFIASTHSPLCAGGLADLAEDAAAMYRFELKSGAVVGEKLEPYRGWTYDQIMTSSAFGLKSVRDVTTQEIGDELREAHAKGDREQIRKKEQELASRSVIAADDERDRQLQAKLRRDLEELQRRAEVQGRAGDSAP
jgi:hypothetical protein